MKNVIIGLSILFVLVVLGSGILFGYSQLKNSVLASSDNKQTQDSKTKVNQKSETTNDDNQTSNNSSQNNSTNEAIQNNNEQQPANNQSNKSNTTSNNSNIDNMSDEELMNYYTQNMDDDNKKVVEGRFEYQKGNEYANYVRNQLKNNQNQ